jgi:AraC-like DNA-binding protein
MFNNEKISYVAGKEESMSLQVYNVGYEKCESNHKWGPGIRDFYLIHYIVSGRGCYFVNNKMYELSAGSIFVIYPHTQITYCADEKDPWAYYWVGFQGTDANRMLGKTDISELNPVMSLEAESEFAEFFLAIYQSKGNEDYSKVKRTGYLFLLLSFLMEKSKHVPTYNNPAIEYSRKAVEYISYNYGQNLSVEGVADYVGISRSHLYRVFVTCFQKTPIQYILEYRIDQACELLKKLNLPISSIGYSVGFEDSLYFSRVFHKITNMSPKEYRLKNKT